MNLASIHAKKSKVAMLLAFFFAVALPLRASGVAPMQAALALGLVLAIMYIIGQEDARKSAIAALRGDTAKWIAIAFCGLAITLPFSPDIYGSTTILLRTAAFLIASLIIWSALTNASYTHEYLGKCLLIASLVFMIATVASISGIPYILSILKGRMIEHEDPAVSFKAFASVALCLIPAMLWAGRLIGGQWKAISYICVALAVVVIWATGNRASLAGLMCMWLTVALLYTLRHQKSWIKLVVLSSITLSIIAIVLFHWNTRIYNLETSYLPEWLVDPHRQQIWRFAFERFLESPLVGNGMDQLNNIPGAHDPAFGLPKNAALVPSHPHNWLLEVLSEAGLVGLLPMIGVICMIFWQKALAYVQKGDVQALALCAVLSGFWSSALFNFSIWAAWWLLTLFTVYAIISIFRETSR